MQQLNKAPLRFNEIKYFLLKYPFVILSNAHGFTTLQRSKEILNTSVLIHSDLTTNWVSIKGISWIDYFLIKLRLRHADKL